MVSGSMVLALLLNQVVGSKIEPIRRWVKSQNGQSAWTMGVAALETGQWPSARYDFWYDALAQSQPPNAVGREDRLRRVTLRQVNSMLAFRP